MTWEALTALGTMISALVIALTVLFTARQVRVTTQQLDHLRRATQLEGVMRITHDIESPQNRESQLFISQELAAKMQDEEFRRGVALAGRADLTVHKEMYLMRFFETLSGYVKYGLIDGDIIYDLYVPQIVAIWGGVAEVVTIHRRAISPQMWENYEWLVQQLNAGPVTEASRTNTSTSSPRRRDPGPRAGAGRRSGPRRQCRVPEIVTESA